MSPLVGSPVSLQTITLNQQCQERKSSKIERINTQELQEEQVKQKVELRRVQSSCNIEILVPSKSPSCLDMEKYEERNGSISKNDGDDDSTTVYFFIGNRREVACWRSDKVTSQEIKELFRSAAEAGPLDIVKLRKCDKILNITPHLLSNTSDDPYILQVVGAHPASLRIFEVDLLLTLERRLVALERELHIHQEVTLRQPYFSLCELKKHYDSLKKKLETTEHLSWLGFYKQLPEPISSEACRRLQYRRKSDSMKRSVREKFLNICDVAVSQNVRKWLRSPAFDARQWEDEELLLMLQTMFVELELPQKFNIPLSTLRNFIYEVYNNYNEVPFHNFRHCFCVAQMMYAIAWAVDLISKIGDREVLVLIVSCVCHDLDHPGYNNIYQINARTELALRYNDISPLENHHCSIAFRILETPECNIFASLDLTTYKIIREGIIRCILATDMARHNEILAQFTDAVLEFDFTSKIHINLLSMVLIKVADISNEARPMDVAEPWLDSLLQEFFKQSDAEKLEGLPITPFMDRDKVTKPSSQCSFIGLVLLPLFEVLGELFPELQELIVQPVRYALEYYRRLNEQAKDERHQRKSVVDVSDHIATVPSGSSTSSHQRAISLNSASSMGSLTQRQFSIVKSTSSHSMRLKRTTCTLHSRSRSIEDKTTSEQLMMQESCDMESSDPETATEVEISEKTLKFKISTESGVSTSTTGRKSYPGSRKGSREKSSLDYHNHELVKAMRGYEHERRRSRGENFNSNMSSPVSGRSNEFRILEELEGDDQHLVELVFSDKKKRKGNGNLRLNAVQQQRDSHLSERNVSVDSNECDFVNANSKEIVENVVRCCCEEKTGANNHKSLLTRLRQITDRLSINFDTKEMLTAKSSKCVTNKNLNKNVLMNYNGGSTSDTTPRQNNFVRICKKCNLRKINNNKGLNIKSSTIVEQLVLSGSTSMTGKHSMTLPKVTRSQDSKNKSWRTVFAKEKRPSISLETLPAESITKIKAPGTSPKHRRNLSHPEGRTNIESVLPKGRISETEQQQNQQSPELQQTKINFKEIDVCPAKLQKCVDLIDSGNSAQSTIKNIGKMEIRRSSASMEDISKITKQSEGSLLGCSLEQKKFDEYQQHAGSLDSMLYKDTPGSDKKPVIVSKTVLAASPQTKKSSAGLFSRFKSGMSTDAGACSSSNSGSLNDQQTQGWISSITASFRARRHGEQPMITTTMTTTMKPASAQSSQEQQQSSSTNREVE